MIRPLPPDAAALVKTGESRVLVIADLHIGWEVALSKEGVHAPTQTPRLLKRINALLLKHRPDKLLVLGDVKHTVASAEKVEWQDVPDFFCEVKKHVNHISVIRGNHDGNLQPLLPEDIEILPASGVALGDTGFFHGHRWPSPSILKCKTIVMGHVHPVVVFRDPAGFRVFRQVWVKATCKGNELAKVLLEKNKVKMEKGPEQALYQHYGIKPRTAQLFIMPSFNDFLGGRPLNERRVKTGAKNRMSAGPMLRPDAVDMRSAEAYLLDGTFLGTLEQLRKLS